MKKEYLKEEIIETSYYLTQAVIMSNIEDIEKLRHKLNLLTGEYKELLTNVTQF